MGAIKNYYHEEICAGEMDNNQDEPTEEQWWEAQDKDKEYTDKQDDEPKFGLDDNTYRSA